MFYFNVLIILGLVSKINEYVEKIILKNKVKRKIFKNFSYLIFDLYFQHPLIITYFMIILKLLIILYFNLLHFFHKSKINFE